MFEMTPGWLPFYPTPSKPKFVLPKGAVDAHCHVFGPHSEFPYAPERKYTPCDASKAQLFALRDYLGFQRNVIVQATCHGSDNRALVDALESANGLARGVAFGWHIVIYFEAEDLPRLWDFFTSIDTTVVVDHMGRPDVTKSADGEEFALFVKLMAENPNFWCKVSCPERLSKTGPKALNGEQHAYQDVVPFAKKIVELFPDRVLFGTDWPHPNLKDHMPDDGLLVDYIPQIAPTAELQEQLLVKNPMRLYWPEEL